MVLRVSLAVSLCALIFLFASFSIVDAQGCDVPPTACVACQLQDPDAPNFCPKVPCVATVPGGTASGMCTAPCKCGANASTGQGGEKQGMGDAKGMMDALKGVMDMLKQAMEKKGGGGGQGQQPQQGQQGLPKGCTQYYQVTAPSTDPCAYYVPPTSDSLLQTTSLAGGGSGDLLETLNEGTALNVSQALLEASGESSSDAPQSETETGGGSSSAGKSGTTPAASSAGQDLSGEKVNLQSGTRGNIVETEGGATIEAQSRDLNTNTEVAGFYGSGSSSSEPQGLIARMCKNRPWAGSIVSFVIPPTFFDSLCARRGYQVGSPAPPAQPVVENVTAVSTTTSARGTVLQRPVSAAPPQVEIWAVPDEISLGARTSVFWNTSGVESCSITSSDGNFNESTLSGGAATVPLSGPTTFTISCLAEDATTVIDYVVVNLAI